MKFKYNEEPDRGECVAYIGGMGGEYEFLVIKKHDGATVLHKDGDVEDGFWSPDKEADHVFMKGDSITITF